MRFKGPVGRNENTSRFLGATTSVIMMEHPVWRSSWPSFRDGLFFSNDAAKYRASTIPPATTVVVPETGIAGGQLVTTRGHAHGQWKNIIQKRGTVSN